MVILTVFLSSCSIFSVSEESKAVDIYTDRAFETQLLSEDLPKEFKISYTVAMANAEAFFSVIKTQNGILIASDAEEILLINAVDGYDVYLKDGGKFLLSPTSRPLATGYANEFLKEFEGICLAHRKYENSLEKTITASVCGRECDVYVFEKNADDAYCKYEYYVDKETGICLKYTLDGKDAATQGKCEFVCTEFETNGISLPQYITGEKNNEQ